MKLEVETVIKTGRQIVQKQQTENPKGMDEQLTALKLLYNDLGAQVTHTHTHPHAPAHPYSHIHRVFKYPLFSPLFYPPRSEEHTSELQSR